MFIEQQINILEWFRNSEGSCDTDDWSNDDENSALITRMNYMLKYIAIENSYFKW